MGLIAEVRRAASPPTVGVVVSSIGGKVCMAFSNNVIHLVSVV